MSKDLHHLTIDVYKNSKSCKKLLSMHRNDTYSFASNLFSEDYRVANGINDFASIKVVDYEEVNGNKTNGNKTMIKVRFSVNGCLPEPKQSDIVYIAGAITGDVVSNRHRFFAAKHSIMASSVNTTVLNPAELPDGLTQTQYMSICLPMVMMSTSIFMLEGWEKSKGAIAEHALALKLGIEITYQGEHDGKL